MINYNDIFLYITECDGKKDFANRIVNISRTIVCELGCRLDDNDVKFDFQVAQILNDLIEDTAPFIDNVNSIHLFDNQPNIPEDFVLKVISVHSIGLYDVWSFQTQTLLN